MMDYSTLATELQQPQYTLDHQPWLARLRTIGLGLGGRGVMGLGLGRSSVGAAAVPWWLSGGVAAANCVAVYQPKGAASLAASYSNLANPGTYDAASGVAPTWASGTGWTFNGTTQYLLTGILPVIDTSTICRFDSASGSASRALFGVSVSANNWRHYVRVREGGAFRRWASGSSTVLMGGALTSGVVALCGSQAYLDGAPDATISRTWANPTIDIAIGAERTVAGAQAWYSGNIVAVAIYNTILSAAQVALISAAMAAL